MSGAGQASRPKDGAPSREHVTAIVGAGISGLALAYYLSREPGKHGRVVVIDAAANTGGVIETQERDGFIVEQGPDCFISTKPAGLELARELGLEPDIVGTNPAHRRSFILHRGRLRPLPQGFYLIAPMSLPALLKTTTLSWRGKLRMASELFRAPRIWREDDDESLASFVRRRFGREALERVAQPMAAGIYTADPECLSLRAAFPDFIAMEREHGSVIRALRARQRDAQRTGPAGTGDAAHAHAAASGPRYGLFVSFRRGMAELPRALGAALAAAGVETRLGTRVAAAGCDPSFPRRPQSGSESAGAAPRRWRLALDSDSGRTTIEADRLCLALPAHASAKLLASTAPALSSQLATIPYASTAVVNLACRRADVAHPLDGMGMVVPAVEGRRMLACSFSGTKFEGRAPEDKVLLRVFIGGAMRPDLAALGERELVALAREELAPVVGLAGEPLFASVSRHHEAMAQYHVGHLDLVREIRALERCTPGLALLGNAFDGVGIPDCIAAAKVIATAEELGTTNEHG